MIAVALACALEPAHALAHGGNPNYRSEIDSVRPPLPSGVTIEVLDYDSYFQLMDRHGHEVVIYGYNDEPYARIEKDGTVQVNERSPATYLNDSRFETDVKVPASADPKAAPEWKTVDDSGHLHLARPPDALDDRGPAADAGQGQGPKDQGLRLRNPALGGRHGRPPCTGRSGGSGAPGPRSCPS